MYNKSEIMRKAWAKTKAMGSAIASVYGGVRKLFAAMLKEAWADARKASAIKSKRAAKVVRNEITMLENKTRWDVADFALRDRLSEELRSAI